MKPKTADSPVLKANRVALAVLSFGAAAAGAVGCQHPAQRAVLSSSSRSPSSPLSTTAAVPLPARTPFDDEPKLRAAYLESYANGYGLAVTNSEYASPGCLCEANGDPRKYDAMADGFFAGRKAGAEAYRVRQAAAGNRQSNRG